MASSRPLPTDYDEYSYNSGGGADYATIGGFETDWDIDLVTAQKGKILNIEAGTHQDFGNIAGATTDADYFRVVRAASGAEQHGIPDFTGNIAAVYQSNNTNNVFINTEAYFCMYDIHISNDNNATRQCIDNRADTGTNYFSGLIITKSTAAGGGVVRGILQSGDGTAYFRNCLIVDIPSSGFFVSAIPSNAIIQNTQVHGCGEGIRNSAGVTTILTNGIITNNTANLNIAGTLTQTTSIVLDVNEPALYDSANSNWFVKPSDNTNATRQGTDLSASAIYSFDDDIQRNTRLYWDIGMSYIDLSSRMKGWNVNAETYNSGGGADWAVMANWESNYDIDNVTPQISQWLNVEASDHDDIVNLTGATNSVTYNRKVTAISGAENKGVNRTDGTIARIISTTVAQTMVLTENYSAIEDLVIKSTLSNAGDVKVCRQAGAGVISAYFVGLLVFDCANSGAGTCIGIATDTGNPSYVSNCIVDNCDGDNFQNSTGNRFVYNCTSKDAGGYCFNNTGGTYTLKNAIGSNGSSGDYNGVIAATTNTAEGATITYGINSNYWVASTETDVIDQGTDLTDDANYAFGEDIRYLERDRTGGGWDIGAFNCQWPHLINGNCCVKIHGMDTERIKSFNGVNW